MCLKVHSQGGKAVVLCTKYYVLSSVLCSWYTNRVEKCASSLSELFALANFKYHSAIQMAHKDCLCKATKYRVKLIVDKISQRLLKSLLCTWKWNMHIKPAKYVGKTFFSTFSNVLTTEKAADLFMLPRNPLLELCPRTIFLQMCVTMTLH